MTSTSTSGPSTASATLRQTIRNLPMWATWMIYGVIGVGVLSVVEEIAGTDRLTSATTSGAMLRWTVPILLAGLGGLFSERAGVINIGLEGMLLLGMWFGAWGTINYGPWIGLLIGIIGGALGALVHAVATVIFGVDHIISGVAILIVAPGATRFLSSEIFTGYDGGSITQSPRLDAVGKFTFPFLAGGRIGGWKSPDILGWFRDQEIPLVSDLADVLRGLTFNLSQMTVIAFLLVPISAWVLWRTRFGLRLRICGENPLAGESQGINIYRYKFIGVMLSGALAGFGGAFIASPELNGIYLEGSTLNRGFIGLAALIIGNYRPAGILAGSLLFAYPLALGKRDLDGSATHGTLLVIVIVLALVALFTWKRKKIADTILAAAISIGALYWYMAAATVPAWWISIQPFLIVLVVLVFFNQRLRIPAADGMPYSKGES